MTSLVRVALWLGAVALPALAAEAAPRTRPVARAPTCESELGAARAGDLAAQCLAVAPGRPSCSPANTCAAMGDEIRRGCLDADDPDAVPFCAAYGVERDEED